MNSKDFYFSWVCLSNTVMPTVEMVCELKEEQIGCEAIWALIQMAADFISRAEKYRGVPYPLYSGANSMAKMSVSFKVIFKSMKDAGRFVKSL